MAIASFNRGDVETEITAHWQDLELGEHCPTQVRDVCKQENLGLSARRFAAAVKLHALMNLAACSQIEAEKGVFTSG